MISAKEWGINMILTKRYKAYIDSLSYRELLAHWRDISASDPWFQGQTGEYWKKRMSELKAIDPDGALRDSESIGFRQQKK